MIEILSRQEGWVAIAKPAGLPVVPTREDPEAPTVQTVLQETLGERLWVVHRLDRDTSGLLLLARTAEAHRDLSRAFELREVEKVYLAVCRRADPKAPTAGRIDLPLIEGRRGQIEVVRVAREGEAVEEAEGGLKIRQKESVTRFRVLSLVDELAVIEARPRTGRRHQIRIHLAETGWPLAVDPRYGGQDALVQGDARCERLTLHVRKLTLPGEPTLVCPPPPDLAPFLAPVLP